MTVLPVVNRVLSFSLRGPRSKIAPFPSTTGRTLVRVSVSEGLEVRLHLRQGDATDPAAKGFSLRGPRSKIAPSSMSIMMRGPGCFSLRGPRSKIAPSKPCMTFNVKIEKLRKLSSQARRLQKISRFFSKLRYHACVILLRGSLVKSFR